MEDNDTKALRIAGAAVTAMDVAYRSAGLMERVAMQEARDDLWNAYTDARDNLLAEGVIVTDAQLNEMDALGTELQSAAEKMEMAQAALKLVGILATLA